MRVWIIPALVFTVSLLAAGAQQPTGSISGKITNPGNCAAVQALLRKGPGVKFPAQPKVFPVKFNAETGAFKAENLPDGEYALRLLVPGGHIEGADMRLEEPAAEGDPFGAEDVKAIHKLIADYPDAFTDIFRPLRINGNSQFASVLVEKIRARQFHSGKAGEIVWRVEVWRLEKRTGAWVKRPRSTTTLSRLRVFNTTSEHHRRGADTQMDAAQFEKLVWLFSPEMGGLEIEDSAPIAGLEITAPPIDAKHGKVAGSVKKQIDEFREKGEKYLE